MSSDRKPSDDLREGLGLLFRAASGVVREVAKEVDLGKAARTAGQLAESAGKELLRVATVFGETFDREIGVRPKSAPPADATDGTDAKAGGAETTDEGFHAVDDASAPAKKGEGGGA